MTAVEYFAYLANGRKRPGDAGGRPVKPKVFRCGCSTEGPHKHDDGSFYDHRPGAPVSFITGRSWPTR